MIAQASWDVLELYSRGACEEVRPVAGLIK